MNRVWKLELLLATLFFAVGIIAAIAQNVNALPEDVTLLGILLGIVGGCVLIFLSILSNEQDRRLDDDDPGH